MKKKIAIILLVTILLTSCMATLCACAEEEPEPEVTPRDVKIELVNPTTGEIMQDGDTIDLPPENTPIEVKIKDVEWDKYLRDFDLPENTIKESCLINFMFIDNDGDIHGREYREFWPTKEDIEKKGYYNYYEISISFDCRPEKPRDPKTFQRKYKMRTAYVRFYINKSWREGDDRYNQ